MPLFSLPLSLSPPISLSLSFSPSPSLSLSSLPISLSLSLSLPPHLSLSLSPSPSLSLSPLSLSPSLSLSLPSQSLSLSVSLPSVFYLSVFTNLLLFSPLCIFLYFSSCSPSFLYDFLYDTLSLFLPRPPHSVLFRVRVCLYPLFEKTPYLSTANISEPPFRGLFTGFSCLGDPPKSGTLLNLPPYLRTCRHPPPPPPLISDKLSLLVGTSSSSSSSS